MSALPWLSVLWLLPAAGAAAVLAIPAARRVANWLTLAAALGALAASIVVAALFDPAGATYQLVESRQWIPALGAGYTLGVDGVAVVLMLLTTVLVVLLILTSWSAGPVYLALTLAVEAMVLISFTALDLLLFYLVFEAMLIPMYFLIGRYRTDTGGSPAAGGAPRAALKFLLYNLFGGLIMLAAVIVVYTLTARHGDATFNFGVLQTRTGDIDPAVAKTLFLGFLLAFAIKAPMWPLHTWLPGVATHAKPATAVLMMAVVDKVGTFGMLRYCLHLFPDASKYFAPALVALAAFGVIYCALVAIGQTDIMRLIAYTSISHFGFIILGVFAMTSQSQTGSTLYMVNHGVATAALFLTAGYLTSRRGTRLISAYGGVQKVAPMLAGTFLTAGLATLALPGLAPFISEFLVLVGTFTRHPLPALAATAALVLSAVYILWLYQRLMGGPLTDTNQHLPDLNRRELAVLTPLIAILLALGVYPKPALDAITPAITHTLTTIDQPDPTPKLAESPPP